MASAFLLQRTRPCSRASVARRRAEPDGGSAPSRRPGAARALAADARRRGRSRMMALSRAGARASRRAGTVALQPRWARRRRRDGLSPAGIRTTTQPRLVVAGIPPGNLGSLESPPEVKTKAPATGHERLGHARAHRAVRVERNPPQSRTRAVPGKYQLRARHLAPRAAGIRQGPRSVRRMPPDARAARHLALAGCG